MPSQSDDAFEIGKTYQDLVQAEQHASELESRLDQLDTQLEELLKMSNLPPELFQADDETLKRIFEAATAQREAEEEQVLVQQGGAGQSSSGSNVEKQEEKDEPMGK